jgi:hypothetical protein
VRKAFVVPEQLRRRTIEHDLVVIPGIIKRRDIDLSAPMISWGRLGAPKGAIEARSSDRFLW